ncbi:MAG: phenylalanine--tRNA ligase subunit beta [Gammaproteobacteria bacterium]|nr:phenylalanine--tRNA ligase subunit beta [Gammaproteobacteria bacterium]
MKFSEHWLRAWVNPKMDSDALAHLLTMAGLEVAAVEPAAGPLEKIVVGRVREVASHPDADRLRVCQVDAGVHGIVRVVCGAPNVQVGMAAPLALPGASIGGNTIRRSKLRGVESGGMLCSASELDLGEGADGLLRLDGARAGTPLAEHLQTDDRVIEIELTPNRGDCLSIAGVAREVSALSRTRLRPPKLRPVPAASRARFPVRLDNPEGCPLYAGRVIKGINPRARTPDWMRERLRRGGQRSLGPLVDVTNYVMLELGQPMHAFDLDKLKGGIRVRNSCAGESLELLDGSQARLDDDRTLLIADDNGPLALAGIMGGAASAVGDRTRNLFLESACFDPVRIGLRARALGLVTESAYRFERGVSPDLQRLAMERATALLLEIVGGTAGPVIEARAKSFPPQPRAIRLRLAQAERLLGMPLKAKDVVAGLGRLGVRLKETGAGSWQALAPAHRPDLEQEWDLIEEIARLEGLDRIPERVPRGDLQATTVPETRLAERRVRQLLADRDFREVVTYSFIDPQRAAAICPDEKPLVLDNPISQELSVMRASLWPGLLGCIEYNRNRQQRRLRLFESGRVFLRAGGELRQPRHVAAAICGERLAAQWDGEAGDADFYDLKGDLQALLDLAGAGEAEFLPEPHPALHPGKCARVRAGGRDLGWLGCLHPALQKTLDLGVDIVLFELDLELLLERPLPAYAAISRFPANRRDLAVVVDANQAAAGVAAVIRKHAGEALTKLELFDVYRGKGIDSTKKSLAFGLTLQALSRTLTDRDVDEILARVIQGLRNDLGAELRNSN